MTRDNSGSFSAIVFVIRVVLLLLNVLPLTAQQIETDLEKSSKICRSPAITVLKEHKVGRSDSTVRYDDDGSINQLNLVSMAVESYSRILPFVFFDSASSEVPARYHLFYSKTESLKFKEDSLVGNALEIYYDVLNVVGYRLKHTPGLKVGLRGNNSSEPEKGETLKLSNDRSLSIYRYLVDVWGIDSSQVQILLPNDLPQRPSNNKWLTGKEENRRVDIVFVNDEAVDYHRTEFDDSILWAFVKPVRYYSEVSAYPVEVGVLMLDSGMPDSLVSWRMVEVYYNKQLWKRIMDSSLYGNYINYAWRNENGDTLPFEAGELTLKLIACDRNGVVHESPVYHLPVQTIDDLPCRRRSLRLLNGLESSSLSRLNGIDYRAINDVLYSPSADSLSIVVTATHDSLGKADRHYYVTNVYADRIANIISDLDVKRQWKIQFYGLGEWSNMYSNDLPEKRFLNRGATIQVDFCE